MVYTSNVPQPTFGPNGFIAPTQAQILAGVIADMQAAFNNTLHLSITDSSSLVTPQGQMATSLTAIIGEVYDTFVYYTNQTNPVFAQGRMQDAIGNIYFIQRIPAKATTLQCNAVGLTGVVIPVNALAQDPNGNNYSCSVGGVIGSGGTVSVTFQCLTPGPIAVPETLTIYQAIPGWDAINVVSGVEGADVESQSAFEARRAASVAHNSLGCLPSVLGAVLTVPGVISAYVTENVTNSPQTIGGVSLNPNSIYVAVVGGAEADVAFAIWSHKSPGCAYTGNTTVIIQDATQGYQQPYPTYSVSYEIPDGLEIVFAVTMANDVNVPADALSLVQNAIVAAMAAGGSAPSAIGGTVFASSFYATIAQQWPGAKIISVLIGSINNPAAKITGSITGTTLTVASVVSGSVAVGQTLIDQTGQLLPGTMILSGSGTSWVVSQPNTVTIETIYGVTAGQYDIATNINQIPTVAAENISLVLV